MRWAAARLLAAVLLLAAWGAHAAQVPETVGGTILLRDQIGSFEAQDLARVWIDPGGEASLPEVLRTDATAFRPAEAGTIYKLGPRAALWLHLRVQRGHEERQDWVVEFPMPAIDRVTLHQFEAGNWIAESAGDTLAVARWPEAGRYPHFRVDLTPGEVRDLYIRIRHTTAANFPVQLATAARQSQRLQLEYLALGGAFGALLLLITGCLVHSWVYRDPVFAWYAGYAALTAVGVAAYTGTAAHLLWPDFGALQDAPVPMLACAAVASALMFARTVLALRRRHPVLDRVVFALAVSGAGVALVPALAPKSISLPLVTAYIGAATTCALFAAVATWLRGDPVAKWVFAAFVPMVLSVLLAIVRVFGWVAVSPQSQYAVVAAMAVEVPVLLVALFIRSRDRHSAQVREQALSTQDALTGLLAPHLFTDRLRQVVARHRREGLSAAVMYVELVNHGPIREHFGSSVAEQSLLRSVIKLRRLLRDGDTVSRVSEARFGVLLEGAGSRASVTERATRLIAAGLMPLRGLKPDVTLHFHVAAVMLHESPLDAEELEAGLRAQLERMSPRTRRPIRFIEADPPPGSHPADSSMFTHGDEPVTDEELGAPAGSQSN